MATPLAQAKTPLWLLAAPFIFISLWSGGFAVGKLVLRHAEPMTAIAMRYGIVLAILLPVFALLRPALPRTRAEWLHLCFTGFCIQAGYFGLTYTAMNLGASAGTTAIIVCLQPILVGLVAPQFAGERVGLRRWIGLALGLTGAAAVIFARSTIAAESAASILAAIGGLIGMTTGTLWEKRFGVSYHPVTSNLVQYAVGFAACGLAAVATESMVVDWHWELVAALAYLVIGNSLIAMSLLLAMIRAGEVSRVSALFFLVPPMSALYAWGLLGEAMPWPGWLGMTIAASGVAIASRGPKMATQQQGPNP